MTVHKDHLKIILAFTLSSLLFLGYYFFTKETKLDIVYKNWDGPSYVLVAMSLYNPELAYQNNFIHSADIHPDSNWLPAHFPLYPLLIRLLTLSDVLGIGYFPAMLLVSLSFTLATYLAFFALIKALHITKHPLLLTLSLIFLSPRWFILSHTGSSESMFLFFLIMFLLFLFKKQHFSAAVFLALAQLTRPHAVFFVLGVGIIALVELVRSRDLKQIIHAYSPYLLAPLAVLAVFGFYKLQTGNFWAFFDAISLTNNLQAIPFKTFSFPSANIETFWQEVNAYDYVLYLSACFLMFRRRLWQYGVLSLAYFIPLIFLAHSDISRYTVPLLPFAFIAYSEIIEKREFNLAVLLMSPAVMLYAINFMDHNHGI